MSISQWIGEDVVHISSAQPLSHVWFFVTPWTAAPTPGAYSNSCPLSWWCHPTISSSVVSFSFHLQSFPASGSFLMSHLFASGGQSLRTSTLASILPVNIQGWFPLDWLVWSPCYPKDSQESSPTSQFEGISSLAFSPLYGQTLTSIQDYWKNHSFDYTDNYLQSDVSAF